jgi:hypothetical protein
MFIDSPLSIVTTPDRLFLIRIAISEIPSLSVPAYATSVTFLTPLVYASDNSGALCNACNFAE